MAEVYLSFSGCGFLGIYHVGAASCIKQYAPQLYQNKVAGASAGALVSCMLICNCCLGQCTSYVLRLAARARMRALGPFHPDFDLIRHLKLGLEEILPMDAHVRCSGRLFVSVTRVSDGEPVLLTNFSTREHLLQALICSTFIPLYSGMTPPIFDGIAYVDGAFSNNLPKFETGTTVTVCPFAGESDICPRDPASSHTMPFTICPGGTPFLITDVNVNRLSQVLFPPHPVDLAKICQDGFRDALRFLSLAGFITKMPDIIQVEACVTSAKTPPVSRVGGRRRTSSFTASDDESANEKDAKISSTAESKLNGMESNVFRRYRRRHGSASDVSTTPSPVIPQQLNGVSSRPNGTDPSAKLYFLPPLGRYEFMEHLAHSEGILYSLFQSKAYRICSVLASPLYLPGEVCLGLARKASHFSMSWVNSIYNSTLNRLSQLFEYFYSTAALYSPIVISNQPDGGLICSLDVVADRLNGESAELIFRKKQLQQEPDVTQVTAAASTFPQPDSIPPSPVLPSRPGRRVRLHLNSTSDGPENVRRLAHGRVDSEAATACLNKLFQRSTSVDGVDGVDLVTTAEEETLSDRESYRKMRRSVTLEDNASAVEQLVGGCGKGHNTPVLSYYYPDRQTDRLLVWELKELDHNDR